MKVQHGFILTEDDAPEMSKEMADRLFNLACEYAERHDAEITDAEREFEAGGGVLLDEALRKHD